MSLVHFEGFDNQTVQQLVPAWAGSVGISGYFTTSTRYSTGSAFYTNVNNGGGDLYYYMSLTNMSSEIIVGFAFNCSDFNTASANPAIIAIFDSLGNVAVRVYANNTGQLVVARGGSATNNGTTLYTSPTNTMLAGWYYFEVYAKIGDSGSVIIRFNEGEVCNLSGIDTQPSSSTTVGGFYLGWGDVNWYNIYYNYDDLYVIRPDGEGAAWFLGDVRVETIFPTGEGTTIDFAPSAGTDNALNVDEVAHDGDTTYNSSATLNAKDTLVYGNLATATGTIHAVRYNTAARKTAGGGLRKIAPILRHGGSDYTRPSFMLSDSYNWAPQTMDEDNPATGVDWTISDINNAEFGYQVTE